MKTCTKEDRRIFIWWAALLVTEFAGLVFHLPLSIMLGLHITLFIAVFIYL